MLGGRKEKPHPEKNAAMIFLMRRGMGLTVEVRVVLHAPAFDLAHGGLAALVGLLGFPTELMIITGACHEYLPFVKSSRGLYRRGTGVGKDIEKRYHKANFTHAAEVPPIQDWPLLAAAIWRRSRIAMSTSRAATGMHRSIAPAIMREVGV